MEERKDINNVPGRDSTFRLSTSKPYFTETIYQNQKKAITDINEKHKLGFSNQATHSEDANRYIIFNDINQENNNIQWQYAMFETDLLSNEETPLIKSKWSESEIEQTSKGIELRNLIFRSDDNVNLISLASDIYFDIVLRGESSFWIILRSSVEFNKYSAILKFTKEDKCQKVFVSYGTFVIDHNGKSIFKVFLKQQLINYNKNTKNRMYVENDMCEIRANVFDNGDDKIKAKIYLNESRSDNHILGSFFLPIYDKSKIMIAGSGQSVLVKAFVVKQVKREGEINSNNVKDSGARDTSNVERRNCDCCLVF